MNVNIASVLGYELQCYLLSHFLGRLLIVARISRQERFSNSVILKHPKNITSKDFYCKIGCRRLALLVVHLKNHKYLLNFL